MHMCRSEQSEVDFMPLLYYIYKKMLEIDYLWIRKIFNNPTYPAL